jgi:hypothetical protein
VHSSTAGTKSALEREFVTKAIMCRLKNPIVPLYLPIVPRIDSYRAISENIICHNIISQEVFFTDFLAAEKVGLVSMV